METLIKTVDVLANADYSTTEKFGLPVRSVSNNALIDEIRKRLKVAGFDLTKEYSSAKAFNNKEFIGYTYTQ